MKKSRLVSFIMTAMLLVTVFTTNLSFVVYGQEGTAKNVIMLIPDGMSVTGTALARYMLPDNQKGTKNLVMDEYVTALMKTTWANGPITDSAPAATALSTGSKSLAGSLGIDENKKPKANVLEAAQLAGKAVGLVATSEFMHATPAGYSAHEVLRSNYEAIAEQMLSTNLTVLLGTGAGQSKLANFDVVGMAKNLGFDIVKTKTELNNYKGAKVWGDFTNAYGNKQNMSYNMDKASEEPSLADMTKKAIEVLNKNSNGFFLMVEGSKVDWAAHANDTIGIVSDVLAFDEAFKAALDFAKADGNTVVIAVTDHGNSGISIGSYDLEGYDKAPFSILEPLKGATKTAEGAIALLDDEKSNQSMDNVLKAYGINPNDEGLKAEIAAFKAKPEISTLVKTMNKKAYIGYTTGGHTGEDVPLYCYAPAGVSRPTGLINNTDVARYVENLLRLNLDETTKKLFVDITDKEGVTIDKDKATATIKSNGKTMVIKANQSMGTLNGAISDFKGQVAVYIDGRFYVPQVALDKMN